MIAIYTKNLTPSYCLDLLENSSLEILKQGYELLRATNADLPQNKSIGKEKDLLLRNLDCAVIQTVHAFKSIQKEQSFDSVKSPKFCKLASPT